MCQAAQTIVEGYVFIFGYAKQALCEICIFRTINDKLRLSEFKKHFKNIFGAEGRCKNEMRDKEVQKKAIWIINQKGGEKKKADGLV